MMNLYSLKNSALLFSGFLAFFAVGCGGGGGSSDTTEDGSVWENSEVVDTNESNESSDNESSDETDAPESDTEEPATEEPRVNEEDMAVLLDEFRFLTNEKDMSVRNVHLKGFEWKERALQSTTPNVQIPALQFVVLGANQQHLYKGEVSDFDEKGTQVEFRFETASAPMALVFRLGDDMALVELNPRELSYQKTSREAAFQSYVTFYIRKALYESPREEKEEKPEIALPVLDDRVTVITPEVGLDRKDILIESTKVEEDLVKRGPYLDLDMKELTVDNKYADMEIEAPAEPVLY
jgi:hypothetical protein